MVLAKSAIQVFKSRLFIAHFNNFSAWGRDLRKLSVFILLIVFIPIGESRGDDPGITKVRLIQLDEQTYSFEADVPQAILSTIKTPILPDGFHFDQFELTNRSGWITLKSKIICSKRMLSSEDEMILRWDRNGIDITVRLLDGKLSKGLFRNSLGGIRISFESLIPKRQTTSDLLLDNFKVGTRHIGFFGIHMLLILVVVWIFPSFRSIISLVYFSAGQGLALVFSELMVPELGLLFSDILLVIVIILLAYYLIKSNEFSFLNFILLSAGFIHSLSFISEIQVFDLDPAKNVISGFAFNMAVDLVHYSLALLFLPICHHIKKKWKLDYPLSIAFGGFGFFLLLMILEYNISAGKKDILELKDHGINHIVSQMNSNLSPGAKMQRSSGLMNTPIMTFLSVEPYEVRFEVLMNAKLLGITHGFGDHLPVDAQYKIISIASDSIRKNFSMGINGQQDQPDNENINFVVLNRGGVTFRSASQPEEVDNALIGAVFEYHTKQLPDSITVCWKYFPEHVDSIEASSMDLYKSTVAFLNPKDHRLTWKNSFIGSQVSANESILVEPYPYPIFSMVIWFGALCLMTIFLIKRKSIGYKRLFVVLFFVGLVIYPFARVEAIPPLAFRSVVASEKTSRIIEDLLNNVYQAFNRREEEDVYDCLAISVTENQLMDIFIQNRRAMVMEDRGGARASVDKVEVTKISNLRKGKEGDFLADVQWKVNGSVNHFGHTHYRQNQYHALVTFTDVQNVWKISGIESYDVKRVY